MKEIKNFFIGLKIHITELANSALEFIFNNSNFISEKYYYMKLSNCLDRAENAYLAICQTKAPKLITTRQLEIIVMSMNDIKSGDQLRQSVQSFCAVYDPIYVTLLSYAIIETFKIRSLQGIPANIHTFLLK